jgi:hypothetical protein
MPNPVTTPDIEAAWRPLSDQETLNAEAWLGHAWAIVLRRRPLIESWMADGSVPEGNVRYVVLSMVLRKLQNPEGKSDEAGDDYRFRRARGHATGELYLTAKELDELTPASLAGQTVGSVKLRAYHYES